MEAYCMKCKEKREAKDVRDVKDVTMKNGKPAQEGACPVCGTRMFRIGVAKPAEMKEVAVKAEGSLKATGAGKGKAANKTTRTAKK